MTIKQLRRLEPVQAISDGGAAAGALVGAALAIGVIALLLGGLRCATGDSRRVGAHVELFAHRHVVVVAAGIGMAPPVRTRGAYVTAARCSYPVRTREPTGLLELEPSARALTLGELFAIWGQPLSTSRLAGFHAPPGTRVAAYLDGRPWPGDPRAVPLRRHAVIVLEIGPFVPPHRHYAFPPGT